MTFAFSQSSLSRLKGVHPKLIAVAEQALSYGVMDLTILPDGGARTLDKEKEMIAGGHSETLNSKHLIQPDGFGHAIDIAPFPVDFNDIPEFTTMATLMFRAAMDLHIEIVWGGHWHEFKDYSHFQLKT